MLKHALHTSVDSFNCMSVFKQLFNFFNHRANQTGNLYRPNYLVPYLPAIVK